MERKSYTHHGSPWDLSMTGPFVCYNWLPLVEYEGAGNAKVRKYAWGLDLGGQSGGPASGRSIDDAGGIGGLLAARDVADAKSYIYFYDANGNVRQLVDRSDGSVDARYEYDAYGNNLLDPGDPNESGPYAAENPFRFSTKYWDDETGLGYWGYRYYSPRLGRWLNRDPAEDTGGENLFVFAENVPIGHVDYWGLWGSDVHERMTVIWAIKLKMCPPAARLVGAEDDATDSAWGTSWRPGSILGGDQGRHFNRSAGGADTRLVWRSRELETAIRICTAPNGDPKEAAKHLGRGLHSVQDYWAHGDFSKGPGDVINSASTIVSHGPGYDAWGMDAYGTQNGVAVHYDGRPPQVFITKWHVAGPGGMPYSVKEEDSWKFWQTGAKRTSGTERDSKSALARFLANVRAQGNCACREFFVCCGGQS